MSSRRSRQCKCGKQISSHEMCTVLYINGKQTTKIFTGFNHK